MTTRRPTDLDQVARDRDAAGAELEAAGAARAAATRALQDANDALAEVVLKALRTKKLIPVTEINARAGVARSRVGGRGTIARNPALRIYRRQRPFICGDVRDDLARRPPASGRLRN